MFGLLADLTYFNNVTIFLDLSHYICNCCFIATVRGDDQKL